MCGIGGLILTPPGHVRPEWMQAFLKHLEHRGPDDSGWLSMRQSRFRHGNELQDDLFAEAMLIHRRLSILDLSEAGHQPMSTPDGNYWITFNGEIYNYVELREELCGLGYTFQSQSDTEVLLTAYRQWGKDVLARLVGMFAFAVLDLRAKKVFLARDCFGIKPLYYAFWQEGLAFASEIKPLLALPGVTRELNARRLYDYLCGGITDHGGETMFAAVKQLPAAHYMELPLETPRVATAMRYWDIDWTRRAELSFDAAATRLRDLFVDSVRMHLRSDVPVGAALSGGIDSSSIVSVMRMLDPSLDIHTFSYIADDPALSEERWVDIVGRHKQTVVHKVRLGAEELQGDLDGFSETQGEPFMSTSMYAQWRVFQAARKAGIKVMLDGQGADELLGGYASHRAAMLAGLVGQGRVLDAQRLARSMSGAFGWPKALARAFGRTVPDRIQSAIRRMTGRDATPAWMNASWFEARGVDTSVPPVQVGRRSLLRELYRTLTETSLPMLLRYEDRNSMAFSIESRVPFLTPALAEFLLSLPAEYLVAVDGTSKAVFRRAMRGIVPDQILDRRDKVGFPTPEREWLIAHRPYVERVLKGEASRVIPALRIDCILQGWENALHGRGPLDTRMWRWLSVLQWAQKFSVVSA
jgi:asparagine synthase (glutamine-hydrolysing)